MQAKNVFQFDDYRLFLKARMSQEKNQWGLISKLAEASGCQRPHLSNVLKGDVHLTASQAHGVGNFFAMSENEVEYFLTLIEIEKASALSFKNFLLQKKLRLRTQNERLNELVQRSPSQSADRNSFYYSHWLPTAAHIISSIPEYQTVENMAARLGVSADLLENTLYELEKLGCVVKKGSRWRFHSAEQHISKESPLCSTHHLNWRLKAVENSRDLKKNSVHFTVVQSLSKKDFEKLRAQILETIREFSRVANPSPEEEIVCFNCDFFSL